MAERDQATGSIFTPRLHIIKDDEGATITELQTPAFSPPLLLENGNPENAKQLAVVALRTDGLPKIRAVKKPCFLYCFDPKPVGTPADLYSFIHGVEAGRLIPDDFKDEGRKGLDPRRFLLLQRKWRAVSEVHCRAKVMDVWQRLVRGEGRNFGQVDEDMRLEGIIQGVE